MIVDTAYGETTEIGGRYRKGAGIARKMGWPTVNITNCNRVKPGFYKVSHPTYGDGFALVYTRVCEVHFIHDVTMGEYGEELIFSIEDDILDGHRSSSFIDVLYYGFKEEIKKWEKTKRGYVWKRKVTHFGPDEKDKYRYTAPMENQQTLEVNFSRNKNLLDFKFVTEDGTRIRNVITGAGNFYRLYETLLQIAVDFLTHSNEDSLMTELDQNSEFGRKAVSIYKRLVERKWSPAFKEVGYEYIGSELDKYNDVSFTWKKIK